MDRAQVTLLALLDVGGLAIDSVYRDTLIHRLLVSFSISGKLLDWLRFFNGGCPELSLGPLGLLG